MDRAAIWEDIVEFFKKFLYFAYKLITQYWGCIQSEFGAARKTDRLVWRLYSRGSLK